VNGKSTIGVPHERVLAMLKDATGYITLSFVPEAFGLNYIGYSEVLVRVRYLSVQTDYPYLIVKVGQSSLI